MSWSEDHERLYQALKSRSKEDNEGAFLSVANAINSLRESKAGAWGTLLDTLARLEAGVLIELGDAVSPDNILYFRGRRDQLRYIRTYLSQLPELAKAHLEHSLAEQGLSGGMADSILSGDGGIS